MIDVVRDMEGLKLAFAEIFEQDFDRARIHSSAESASEETRKRLVESLPPLQLSPGYHRFAYHLMQIESEIRVGVRLNPTTTPQFETSGLLCLESARTAFNYKHPPCGACGTRQSSRFGAKCESCGVDFRRRKK